MRTALRIVLVAAGAIALWGSVSPARAILMTQMGRSGYPVSLQLRQDALRGVYYTDPIERDRDGLRMRTRFGAYYSPAPHHYFELGLASEFRRSITPEAKLDLGELYVDQLLWQWAVSRNFGLTLGRQRFDYWSNSLLMGDGTPLDGDRSTYFNALSAMYRRTEFAAIVNPKRDPLVIAGDEHRPLAPAREIGLAVRRHHLAAIYKDEHDPDHQMSGVQSWTLGARRGRLPIWGEIAVQYQARDEGPSGWALANWTSVQIADHSPLRNLTARAPSRSMFPYWWLNADWLFYSGDGEHLRAYRTPWGRGQYSARGFTWSELLANGLVAEDGYAAWANIAGPGLSAGLWPTERIKISLDARRLFAPQTSWRPRGTLFRARWSFSTSLGRPRLGPPRHRLTQSLLWECLAPDRAFYPDERFQQFFRWELYLNVN